MVRDVVHGFDVEDPSSACLWDRAKRRSANSNISSLQRYSGGRTTVSGTEIEPSETWLYLPDIYTVQVGHVYLIHCK